MVNRDKNFKTLLEGAKKSPFYIAQRIATEIAYKIEKMLKEKKMLKKNLADILDVTPAYVSKLLSGNANMSLLTLSKLAVAMNCDTVDLVSKDCEHRMETKEKNTIVFTISTTEKDYSHSERWINPEIVTNSFKENIIYN